MALLALALLAPRAQAQKYSSAPSFQGADGGSAPEGMLAVGPNHILAFTFLAQTSSPLKAITFFSKTGSHPVLASRELAEFFGENGAGDPICFYDSTRARFLMVNMMGGAVGQGHYLAISKANADPTVVANWWIYKVPADMPIDYPGLGVSDDKLVLTSGPAPYSSTSAQRLYVLDRARAYGGLYPLYPSTIPATDVKKRDLPSDYDFKPCRNLTPDATIHLVGKRKCDPGDATGCNEIVYVSLTGAPTNDPPQLSPVYSVTASADYYPPSGEQKGAPLQSSTCVPKPLDVGLARLPDLYARNGNVTVAWMLGRDYGTGGPLYSAVRCIRFRASDRWKLDDFYVGTPGTHYTFPSAIEDARGTVLVGFDRYSPQEFPSSAMVARHGGSQSQEFLVRASDQPYVRCKNLSQPCAVAAWGDYTSMVVDQPGSTSLQTKAYYLGQWVNGASGVGLGSTYIGQLNANYGACAIRGTVVRDVSGVQEPMPGAPVVLLQSGLQVASATTDVSGAFSFDLLPAGTYTLNLAWDSNVALQSQAGTGASGTANLDANNIWIQLKGTQSCIGNKFVVNPQPFPVITSLSQNSAPAGANVTLDVIGTGFRAWSVVRFDGRPKGTEFVPATGNLRVTLTAEDLSAAGAPAITVQTPAAPGGGVSAGSPFMALPPFLTGVTFTTQVVPCPKGDAGHITCSAIATSAAQCGVDLATATIDLVLTFAGAPDLRIWEGATPDPPPPSNPTRYVVPAVVTNTPPGQKTFSFDVSKISGCGTVQAGFEVSGSGVALRVPLPNIDVRSFDLEASVRGAVDQFDQARVGQLLGSGASCADFNRSNATDAGDVAALAAHMNHRAQEMRLTYPNSGTIHRDSGITPSISWIPGEGPQAKVTLNLINGSTTSLIVANAPDNGEFPWTSFCDAPISVPLKVEVLYSAGDLPPGSTTSGVLLGSDRSDGTFQLVGPCLPELTADRSGEGDPAVRSIPRRLELGLVRPNPTRGDVGIGFGLPTTSRVHIAVFDAAGRLIQTLVNETRAPGTFEARWDLRDRSGRAVSSGLYFCRMEVGGWRQQRTVIVTR